jgi:hypothetical protein
MSAVTRIFLIALFLTLTGCASGPRQTDKKLPGQACIDDDASYANRGFTPTQGSLSFQAVNDTPIKGTPLCLAPGRHKIKLNVQTDFRKMDGVVELDLKSDVSYWLRAKLNGSFGFGNAFDFQLIDVTDNKRVIVSEFSVPAEVQIFEFIYIPGGVVPVLIRQK